MLLFFISLILVFAASGFVAAVIENKKFSTALCSFLIIAFANLVVTFEILSLFSAISKIGVLSFNILFLIASIYVWHNFGKPKFQFNFKRPLKHLGYTLLKDKYLLVLFVCSIFMCAVSVWLISFMPILNPDAEGYHVLRSLFWISDKNLNHFNIADIRCNVFPINSEILYTWIFLFLKKDIFIGAVSFSGFILTISALFGVLTNIGLNLRKKLWVILITSSFASVIVQTSSTETDIIISGLVLTSIYFYWNYLKSDYKIEVFLSALAYALAVGTKSPALILVPGVGVWMIAMSIYYKKKEFYKPFLTFLACGFVNFLLFGAYNYILNLIDYGNIAGSKSFLTAHRNHMGLKTVAADFIKYIFMFFDFTGFTWNKTLGVQVLHFRDSLLASLGFVNIQDGYYSTNSSVSNNSLLEPLMGLGVLGFLTYLPCLIWAAIKPIFKRTKKEYIIFSFACILIISLLVMAYTIQFMTFSIRFFTSFCVVASPVLAYSYFKKNNLYKFIVVFFAVFYLLFVSTSLWARPAGKILQYFQAGASIAKVRHIASCSFFYRNINSNIELMNNPPVINSYCGIRDKVASFDKRNKILYLSNTAETIFLLKMLDFKGYHIDFELAENIGNIDISKYNMLVIINDFQESTNVINYENRDENNLYINSGVICKYVGLDSKEVSADSKDYPFESVCKFTDYFYQSKGFELYDKLQVQNGKKNKPLVDEYKFYQNINNPIIKQISPSN